MAYFQKLNIPSPQIKIFEIDNYDGGLNNVNSSFVLDTNESPTTLNMIQFDKGSIETRPGIIKWIINKFTNEIVGMYQYETSLFSYLIINDIVGNIYKYNNANGAITLIANDSNKISGYQYGEKFYYVNGIGYYEFDGTSVREIVDPSLESGFIVSYTSNTVTLPPITDINDDYTYVGWYYEVPAGNGISSGTISAYNSATRTLTIDYTIPRPAPTTAVETASIYYITETEIDIPEVSFTRIKYSPPYTSFINSQLGTNIVETAGKCKRITGHKGSMIFSNYDETELTDDIILTTDINNPYYVPSNRWQGYYTGDVTGILGCTSFNDVLVVWKRNSVHALYGDDETNFVIKDVTVSCGTASFDTVQKVDNSLVFLGSNGHFYSMFDLRSDVQRLTTKSISIEKINIQQEPINIYIDELSNAKAVFVDKYYMCFVKDKILVYYNGSWSMWDNIIPTALLEHNNVLLLSDANKYIYRLPLSTYIITENYISADEQKIYDLKLGYFGSYEGSTLTINGLITEGGFNRVTNSQIELNTETITAGTTISIKYLSTVGYNDNGVKYNVHWKSKDYDLNYPTKIKQIKKFNICTNTYKYFKSTIDVSIFVDHNEILNDIYLNSKLALWGIAHFGDRFVINDIIDSKNIKITKRGRIFSFKLSTNEMNNPFKLYTLYGEYTIRK